MAREKHRCNQLGAAKPRVELADVLDSWTRLEQSDKAMFFAALVRAAMTKRALEAELSLHVAFLKDCQAELSASVEADLAVMGTESDEPGPGRG